MERVWKADVSLYTLMSIPARMRNLRDPVIRKKKLPDTG